MTQKIIGRQAERALLDTCTRSDRAELVAVYGRRRVGKTYLVRQHFADKFAFYATGLYGGSTREQLRNFGEQLAAKSGSYAVTPHNWHDAFGMLRAHLESLGSKTAVVFLDELPWFDTPRSRFVQELDYFWNSWGAQQTNLKLIVCGSAATWMLRNMVGAKGGLHNRLTHSIRLQPFTLKETEELLQSRHVNWDRYTLLECYAIFGGIPYYLSMLDGAQSLVQNVDRLLFAANGELRNEYKFVFRSLFENYGIYHRVVELLGKRNRGMTREQIQEGLKMGKGGVLTTALENLQNCDFIRKYTCFGKKQRNALYQLCDPLTLFHINFVAASTGLDENYWANMLDHPKRTAWLGYAFEQVCLAHLPQIKQALGIRGILTETSSWTGSDGETGGQIDLVIDRRDRVVNLCEMKYALAPFEITKRYNELLRQRTELFRKVTKTTKSLNITLVTTFGVKQNAHAAIVGSQVVMDDLFQD